MSSNGDTTDESTSWRQVKNCGYNKARETEQGEWRTIVFQNELKIFKHVLWAVHCKSHGGNNKDFCKKKAKLTFNNFHTIQSHFPQTSLKIGNSCWKVENSQALIQPKKDGDEKKKTNIKTAEAAI